MLNSLLLRMRSKYILLESVLCWFFGVRRSLVARSCHSCAAAYWYEMDEGRSVRDIVRRLL